MEQEHVDSKKQPDWLAIGAAVVVGIIAVVLITSLYAGKLSDEKSSIQTIETHK